jgi:hypothetical protein
VCLIEPLSNSRGAAHLRYSLELVLVWCRAWGRRELEVRHLLWRRVREGRGGGRGERGRGEGGGLFGPCITGVGNIRFNCLHGSDKVAAR